MLALNFLPDTSAVPPSFSSSHLRQRTKPARSRVARLQTAMRAVSRWFPRVNGAASVLAAFTEELQLGGGQLIARGNYSASESDYTVVIQRLLRISESRDRYAKLAGALGTKARVRAEDGAATSASFSSPRRQPTAD